MKDTIDIVPPQFRKYVGHRPWYEEPTMRARQMAFTLLTESLGHPQTPFFRIARNGLLLNDQTHDFLYKGNYGFIDEPYRKGTRPILEEWVNRYVKPGMSDGDKAIALSQSMHYDLPKAHPKVPVFLYGESDEETILKGGGHCSCRGRLLTALCQVAGLQARPAMMWVWVDEERDPKKELGGHTVAEVFIDGQWGFFDPQHHCYAQTADGRFPSIAEIKAKPEVFTRTPKSIEDRMQPDGYKDAIPGMNFFEYYWYKNFNPKCPISISRHDVNNPGKPHWHWATKELRDKQAHDYDLYRKLLFDLAKRGELTEKVYRMTAGEFRQAFELDEAQMPVFA